MSGAVMMVMALLPGIPMLPFLAARRRRRRPRLRDRQAAEARNRRSRRKKAEAEKGPPRRRADRRRRSRSTTSRSSSATRCCRWSTPGRRRPPHRADQGAAPLAGHRDGLRHAGGAHPRQRPARGQHLRHQDQGGRGRHRPGLAGPVHGHGPDRRAGEPARRAHHRADLRPARDLGRHRAEGRGGDEGLHGGRCRDRAVDPPDRAAQGQHRGAAVLRRGAQAHQGTAEGTGRAGQGHRAGADHDVGHPARAAAPAERARLDPRSRDHPGRHRRRAVVHAQSRHASPSMCGCGSPARSAPSTPRRRATCR